MFYCSWDVSEYYTEPRVEYLKRERNRKEVRGNRETITRLYLLKFINSCAALGICDTFRAYTCMRCCEKVNTYLGINILMLFTRVCMRTESIAYTTTTLKYIWLRVRSYRRASINDDLYEFFQNCLPSRLPAKQLFWWCSSYSSMRLECARHSWKRSATFQNVLRWYFTKQRTNVLEMCKWEWRPKLSAFDAC